MERAIEVGDKATLTKVFTEEDVLAFSKLSLDDNPVHLSHEFANYSIFGQRIVHGFLYSSLISAILGTKLPGPGTIYMKQSMQFVKPVYLNEAVTAIVEVIEIEKAKARITLATNCYKNDSELVVKGEALVKLP